MDLVSGGVNKVSGDMTRATEKAWHTEIPACVSSLGSRGTPERRAEKISEKSGGKIDKLISAQMGIIQITGQNSNEDYSYGGTFNTSSKEKTASITMKLTYKIK